MKLAPAVQLNKKLLEQLEDKVEDYIRQALFQKIFDILEEDSNELQNADNNKINIIIKALRDGLIYFDGHYFKPKEKFGVRVAKEFQKLGAVLKNGGYKLPDKLGDPTIELIKTEVEKQRKITADKLEKVNEYLLEVTDYYADMDISEEVGAIIDSLGKSVKGSLGIQYDLDAYTRNRLVESYVLNIQKYSKFLLNKANIELKTYVAAQATTLNLTTKALGKLIEERYGIAARHARFIAHQEAHMAKEQMNRTGAEKLGFRHYVWQTVGDYRVRPAGGPNNYMGDNHRRLNGKVFSFDEPPIVDRIKGKRCNPSEDFGCRCTARVIIDDEYFEM